MGVSPFEQLVRGVIDKFWDAVFVVVIAVELRAQLIKKSAWLLYLVGKGLRLPHTIAVRLYVR